MGGASRHDRPRDFARPDPDPGATATSEGRDDNERDPDYVFTVVGLFFFVVVVAGVLVLLDTKYQRSGGRVFTNVP